MHRNALHRVPFPSTVLSDQFFFEDDHGNVVTVTKSANFLRSSSFGESSGRVSTLLKKNKGSSKMVLLLKVFMSPWAGPVNSYGSASSAVKLKWNGHFTCLI